MSESPESTFRTEQTRIKNMVDSNSEIELMVNKIATKTRINAFKASGKKMFKNPNAKAVANKETRTDMVYYQSTPVVIKTEKLSQAEYCSQLQMTCAVTSKTITKLEGSSINYLATVQHLQQNKSNANCNNIAVMQQREHESIIPANSLETQTKVLNISSHTNMKDKSAIDIHVDKPSTFEAPTPISSVDTSLMYKNAINRKPTEYMLQFKCEQCGMNFGSKSAHTSHTKSHKKSIKISAGADVSISGLAEINDIVGTTVIPKTPNMSGDPYECNVCKKTFAVPARLIRHYRTHTGERPFECEFCHKLFSVKENLQVHRRIHTKERPYKCDVCGRAFEHSGKLHRHMRIHTGERPHKCSVCEKTFIQSGQLVIHMRTHTGEKPYKCPVEGCGKGFTCSKQLKVHSRTHTGEKPYHCDICFRDFGYNHVLKLHRVQHYGSKCYKCTICEETFKSKKEMEAHIKGHAKELPDEEEDNLSATGEPSNSTSGNSSSEASPLSSRLTAKKASKSKDGWTCATSMTPVSSSLLSTMSTMSPRCTLSPSSSLTSRSCYSTDSPELLPTLPQTRQTLEVDYHSNDSGEVSAGNIRHLSPTSCSKMSTVGNAQSFIYKVDEVPRNFMNLKLEERQFHQPHVTKLNRNNHTKDLQNYPQEAIESNYQQLSNQQNQSAIESHTINPALLEAASIVRQRDMLLSSCETNDTRSKMSQKYNLFSKHRSRDYQTQQYLIPPAKKGNMSLSHEISSHDDTREANELIKHYKGNEDVRHEVHQKYAPVPKYESTLLDNEIVRQVEAAIAPLRSSTESPDGSSSPESDSMMMADRDIMTLPLRKRKVYIHEGSPIEVSTINVPTRAMENPLSPVSTNVDLNATLGTTSGNKEIGSKVMRMSSVIKFAKAS